ncbi:MAG TPA: PTS glucose transporter subunit IIA [Pseudonocardiaceae bacterium]|nr:PTS glucose transporter subunit IIA [Pseudonocardiaceae bacterium]
MTFTVASPVAGRVVRLAEVPDPVFAQAMVGPGVAVVPESSAGDVVSPVAGTIATLHPHAFVVATPGGQAVLVHLGIDTVRLKGEGFVPHVAKGDSVAVGQPVVGWDPAAVAAAGYATVCPIIALDAEAEAVGDPRADGPVEVGERLFDWH